MLIIILLKKLVKKLDEEELISVVNDSVRLTLFRSVLTTLTTIIPVICLMILGASEIVVKMQLRLWIFINQRD